MKGPLFPLPPIQHLTFRCADAPPSAVIPRRARALVREVEGWRWGNGGKTASPPNPTCLLPLDTEASCVIYYCLNNIKTPFR